MKNLTVKKKVNSFKGKYIVTDETGNRRYLVEGSSVSSKKAFEITDITGVAISDIEVCGGLRSAIVNSLLRTPMSFQFLSH